ncbi:phage tail assembly protein [Burkholderia plantarii]|uniref:phage tail assembly protein n=1 Tax=Burkholderia plantarii TaxID=41899 RepID=UPI000870ABDB|nr:phage tail assembly protein [Burkholderia plantarii]
MTDETKQRKRPPASIEIPLTDSITIKGGKDGDEVHTELNLRQPNLRQIRTFMKIATTKDPLEAFQTLISEQSGIPMKGLDNLAADDYWQAQEYLSFFLTPTEPAEGDSEGNS